MSSTEPILITVELCDEGFRLMATSYNMTEPAGPRLFRAPPHPDVRFVHERPETAEVDAQKLREYLEAVAAKRQPTKKQARQMGAT